MTTPTTPGPFYDHKGVAHDTMPIGEDTGLPLYRAPAQPITGPCDPLPGFVPAFVRLDGAIFDGTPPISHHTVSNGPTLHVDLMGRRVSQVAQPIADVSAPSERKLLKVAMAFAKEHIEGDALHDDETAADEVVHASDERYNESKRLLCDAYLELMAGGAADCAPTDERAALKLLNDIALWWHSERIEVVAGNPAEFEKLMERAEAFMLQAARAAAPWRLAEKVACWSCNYHYTESERSAADGNCPRCNVEIQVESAAPESGEM